MPNAITDRATLVSSCFLKDDNSDVTLMVNILPNDELNGVIIRLNGRKIFPKSGQGVANNTPVEALKIGNSDSLRGKELIIDSFIVDDENDPSDDTFIEIKLTGLLFAYERILHQRATPNGSKVIYRIEIKFY